MQNDLTGEKNVNVIKIVDLMKTSALNPTDLKFRV